MMSHSYIAYHGTPHMFPLSEFDLDSHGYFTDNEQMAWKFATPAGRVIAAQLVSKKPYEIDWQGNSWGGGMFPDDEQLFEAYVEYAADGDPEEREYWEDCGLCIDMFASFLEDRGYDLLIAYNVVEEDGDMSNEYIALNGCQLVEL